MTRPISLFFDEDFDSIVKSLINGSGGNYVNYNFPPADVLIDEDKNLTFYFALAGYKKEDINISFSGDAMVVKITPHDKKLEDGVKYLNKGIKHAKCANRYYVPYQRYDTDSVKAVFEDGLLKVEVPSKAPEKARSVEIQ